MSNFFKYRSAVAEEKSKMSQQIRGKGGHLCFPIGPKNTNFVENVEFLLPVDSFQIRVSGFREEVGTVPANLMPGQPSWFPDRPEKS